MKPLILNAWPRASREESRICLESTSAPAEVLIGKPRPLSDGDYSVPIEVRGLGLAMAPDDILVADGLIRRVRVGTQTSQAIPLLRGAAKTPSEGAASASVKLDVILEHAVEPLWTSIPGMPVRTEFSFSRSPLQSVFTGRTIAVDPGHGGKDVGVRGPVNLLEKNIALEVALILHSMLRECGANVLMSRDRDCDVDPERWTSALAVARPELLVEIHASGERDPMARSYHVFARRGSEESAHAAGSIAAALVERMGVFISGIEESDFVAIPLWPAVRVEPLCLTHFVDEANFRAPLFRKRIAQAIFNGISRYFVSLARGGAERVG
ncbi:MAG: N-acetylmuramoyl-L-alanine amidase family protein [Bacillota bacterium]